MLFGIVSLVGQAQMDLNTKEDVKGDFSAYSVSLSDDGKTMAIGAHYDMDNDSKSGHVRVYRNSSGVWSQMGSDINGEVAEDWSGYSVSLSGNGSIIAIGAVHNNDNGVKSGHVRVYEYNTGDWIQIGADINGEKGGDWSGYSVSLSDDGGTVAIGAVHNSANGASSGQVRVYKNVTGKWVQIGGDIDGKGKMDYLGASVSLSNDGTMVAIGAHQGGGAPGYVRVYENFSGEWVQIGDDIEGEEIGSFLGWSVGLSGVGDAVTVGAYLNNDNGERLACIRVYKNVFGDWVQMGTDIDGEANGDDLYGLSVGVSSGDSFVIIGAYEKNRDVEQELGVGHVRVYENNSGDWVQIRADVYEGRNNGI